MADHAIHPNPVDAKSCLTLFFQMKYYQINPNVIFRNYGDFGYITDNRNFGYHFTNTSYVLGDRIVSESGAVILSCLEKSPRPLVEILNRVMKRFVNANKLYQRLVLL